MAYKDLAKQKENKIEYYEKNREEIKEKKRKYYEQNKEEIHKKHKEYRDAKIQNAYDSIMSGHIVDQQKWDMWCDQIKRSAGKHPYSADFTNDVMFDMMVRGCHYCGDIATTIDRLNSALDHIPRNCVGCCGPCNISKGTADSSTFIRKSYFKVRRKYVDDVTDIWFVNKNKPNMAGYKDSSKKNRIPFELSKEVWEQMIVDECGYCHRMPNTWFGIDRVVPSLGYVDGNVVTCCYDCNLDKHKHDVETTMVRNERIAKRVDDGILIIKDCPREIIHRGTNKSSKKVCVYGKVYESQNDASRSVKNVNDTTKNLDVRDCIRDGRYPDDIFRVSDEFYNFVIKNNIENITKKMYVLFYRM
jgi:hypothetical protein